MKPFRFYRVICACSLSLAIALPAAPTTAQTKPGPVESDNDSPLTGREITPELERSVASGLEFLASRQQADGSFGISGITALSGIAFMAGGNLPGRGKYGDVVQRAVDNILASAQESGLLSADDAYGVMYSHGFATLFLAEVYGMTADESVKEKLQRAVALIHRAQNPDGGWRYTPMPIDADVSVTICQVMALRAARDAGIKVERNVIEKAISYVKRCQNQDGGFDYMLTSEGSAFPRSAAGVATLFYAGVYQGREIENGLKYVDQFRPGGNIQDNAHYYYGQYYAVQTMFLAGGKWWENWFPAIREELISKQNRATGSWTGDVTDEYATAMSLIILQMPNRYLPVFSGKGRGS